MKELAAIPTDTGTATALPTNTATNTATVLPTDTATATEMATATAAGSPTVIPTDITPGPGPGVNFDLLAMDIIEDEHAMSIETALVAQRLVHNITLPPPRFHEEYQSPPRFEPR